MSDVLTPTEAAARSRAFLRGVGTPEVFVGMFDVLPDVCVFVKDRRHRYMKVNRGELALHGCAREHEMIGRTDFDFNPPVLAAQYVEEDRRVMESRRPLLDQVWLVQGADGMPRWYISSKFPLLGARGAVVGLAGVMRPYHRATGAPAHYERLTAACEFVLAHYGERISMADLARKSNLSRSQLHREFRRLFRMSPGDYILRVRLLMARRQLEQAELPVGRIALECGFYDQSHFTRAFQRATGMTPLAYRRRFAAGFMDGEAAET